MTKESIEAMLTELERVRDLAKRAISAENICRFKRLDIPEMSYYLRTGKLTGSLRRASLDLTRALADMRKP